MKRIMLVMTLLGVVFSANLWAHHAAEGIVSDEVWNQIDDNLEAASSPHLDIDFDDPGCLNNLYDCMGTDLETIDDSLYMVTTVEVYFLTPGDLAYSETIIDTYFEEAFVESVEEINQIPSGALSDDTARVFYVTVAYVDVDDDDDYEYAIIDLYEPIGSGQSQQAAATVVATPIPGKRGNDG